MSAATNSQLALDVQAFNDLISKTHKEQAIWFLNAFWTKSPKLSDSQTDREKIWSYYHTCCDLDLKKEDGTYLDEFNAHRLLEKLDTALTVKDMREALVSTFPKEFNSFAKTKRVTLTEFLIYKYKADWKILLYAPQASGKGLEQLNSAQEKVRTAQLSVENCKIAVSSALEAEKAQKNAENEVKKTLDEIRKEENNFNDKKESLEKQGQDQSLGIVKRNKAIHELQQLLASDPLPLKTAKISQEAAVRKQERATKELAMKRLHLEESRKQSEQDFETAKQSLDEIKETASAGLGKVWWLERELDDAKKFMSQKQLKKLVVTNEGNHSAVES